ncbi:hypothetical protein JCM11641_002125, partial [Rhodosporidiobolus odoratus]
MSTIVMQEKEALEKIQEVSDAERSSLGEKGPISPSPVPPHERKEHGLVIGNQVIDASVPKGPLRPGSPTYANAAASANRPVHEGESDIFHTPVKSAEVKVRLAEAREPVKKEAEKKQDEGWTTVEKKKKDRRIFREKDSSSSGSESDAAKLRLRRRQPRASVGYNSVVKNGPAPVEVRGQSVRDDVAASMKPVEAGR